MVKVVSAATVVKPVCLAVEVVTVLMALGAVGTVVVPEELAVMEAEVLV